MVMRSEDRGDESNVDLPYEPPTLTSYGTIEEWTRGSLRNGINISIVI